jgi:pilus assembly protein Flp/PilA
MLFVVPERGQGLVEYALIIVLVALLLIVAISLVAPAVSAVFLEISTELNS